MIFPKWSENRYYHLKESNVSKILPHFLVIALSVQEPWFSYLKSGAKTIEGRLNRPPYSNIERGTILRVNDELDLEVVDIIHCDLFESLIKQVGIDRILPGVKNTADGVDVYRQFYSTEKEKEFGVLGIEVRHLQFHSQ